MEDRQFTEVDLRLMLEYAKGLRPDVLEGRFVDSRHASGPWEVVVEPDELREPLVVVTAYPVDRIES